MCSPVAVRIMGIVTVVIVMVAIFVAAIADCGLASDIHNTTLAFEVGKVTLLAQRAPFQGTCCPQVQQAGKQDGDEYSDFDEAEPTGFTV